MINEKGRRRNKEGRNDASNSNEEHHAMVETEKDKIFTTAVLPHAHSLHERDSGFE